MEILQEIILNNLYYYWSISALIAVLSWGLIINQDPYIDIYDLIVLCILILLPPVLVFAVPIIILSKLKFQFKNPFYKK
jgi:hypothetical protein